MHCHTRRAELSDASAASVVVRRSIVELCVDDHRDDATTLSEWLGNKTQTNFEAWIVSSHHMAVVAEIDEVLVGFGLLNLNGTIALLYVSPEVRFRGVSKTLLSIIEQKALVAGIREIKLESSVTALKFYESTGYSPNGVPVPGFGCTLCYPMSKLIAHAEEPH